MVQRQAAGCFPETGESRVTARLHAHDDPGIEYRLPALTHSAEMIPITLAEAFLELPSITSQVRFRRYLLKSEPDAFAYIVATSYGIRRH